MATPSSRPEPASCGSTAFYCECRFEAGHEGPHECKDEDWCGGAWEDRLGGFEVVRFPIVRASREGWNRL